VSTQPAKSDVLLLNVDDHDAGRYAKTRILRSAGFNVIEANRGEEALALVRDRKPDVVLLDVKLPDMNGIEVCRQIKSSAETASTLVIQNSASFVGAADRVRGLEGGADAYLTAPIDPGVLVATVGAMLRLSAAERGLRATEEQLKRLVEQERAARERAERADRSKDEFVATLSHELRTPLTAILGWIGILKPKPDDATLVAKGLEVIERNGRAQLQLVEDLLDMSRILSGKMRLDVQTVDIVAVIENAIASVRLAADAKGIRLERTLTPPVSPIIGDPTRIQQIVWNLLTNALKFTPRAGMIQVRLRADEHTYEISVTDSGEGIDPAFLPSIFDRFRQADASTTRRHAGLGIGLSVVKSLAELHGGSIRATSPGLAQGSTFTLELPISASRPPPSPLKVSMQTEPRPVPTGPLPSLAGVQVLAVDDDPDAREVISRILTEAGASVTMACSAEDALVAIRSGSPGVLVSDIGMPEQDGYALIRRVRAMETGSGRSLPAIALTALARSQDAAAAQSAGFHSHVPKPIDAPDLVRAVAKLAGRG